MTKDGLILTNAALNYTTDGGIKIIRHRDYIAYEGATDKIIAALDSHQGALFSSNYEYPGRYTRWDTGIIDPPLVITSSGRNLSIRALNSRGIVLLNIIKPHIENLSDCEIKKNSTDVISLYIKKPTRHYTEEERTRMPSVFSVLRKIVEIFHSDEDKNLGLFGAFGYDLAFQLEPIDFKIKREHDQRDLVLYLPDAILMVDHHATQAWVDRYDFSFDAFSTIDIKNDSKTQNFIKSTTGSTHGDHNKGAYANLVREAKKSFACGDLFEVVPGQTFYEPCKDSPAAISQRLKKTNPSPYSFFINLGEQEYLVGASPEMFVRVNGRRVETCPISGTIKRGEDAIADSEQILKLLNSTKDEAELTMCSDVDRNDKSRVCDPGSVRVIGRRQIELYSRLIHTVDHIEGRLRSDMDAFDAFLSHAWAVTVTGAPKLWAMRFIEEHEMSPRVWYGGAIGMMHFNGNMNTGLTLRTVRIKNGIAAVRAGATLLFDSNPEEEEAETELKASAMIAAIRGDTQQPDGEIIDHRQKIGENISILLIDHEDSFVHMLANYFRQTGAHVTTIRAPIHAEILEDFSPDLVVLSPGPGNPKDFDCAATIALINSKNIPIFGVCLGLQALVEAYGGSLKQLPVPMHGKPSRIKIIEAGYVFKGLPSEITVGRYHSLYADKAKLPTDFIITAETQDGIIMGIEHKNKRISAVQFHPESIMSLGKDAGLRIIENVIAQLPKKTK